MGEITIYLTTSRQNRRLTATPFEVGAFSAKYSMHASWLDLASLFETSELLASHITPAANPAATSSMASAG